MWRGVGYVAIQAHKFCTKSKVALPKPGWFRNSLSYTRFKKIEISPLAWMPMG
jgi:hypothetical protein